MNKRHYSTPSGIALLSIPVWLPIVYTLAVWLELKFTRHGPLNELAIYALFAAPAIGGLPILTSSEPIFARLFVFPIYYLGALFIAGMVGLLACGAMHVCH